MKKLILTLLIAAVSFSTFAIVIPQQDTTKTHKEKVKPKGKKSTKWGTKKDTTKKDTLPVYPVKKDTLHHN